jgi:phosphoribosylformimino-5-aminoimidazole carboxamide ribonucleotide (ProFAR) isomerase
LEEVEKLNEINVNSVIGMAFYSGKIKLEDMLKYK